MRFHPHVTVAAVVEREGRFLMVRERIEGKICYNQPAGHLEPGESLLDAVIRETLEETGWHFRPDYLIGLYRWVSDGGVTFLRATFGGHLVGHDETRELDTGIEAVEWLSCAALAEAERTLRSPLVRRSVDDYLAGRRFPLECLSDVA